MSPLLVAFLNGIVQESPALVGKLLGIWHEQGKVTAEQVDEYVSSFDPRGGEGFFVPTKPA